MEEQGSVLLLLFVAGLLFPQNVKCELRPRALSPWAVVACGLRWLFGLQGDIFHELFFDYYAYLGDN
jgi:hypothetical protein